MRRFIYKRSYFLGLLVSIKAALIGFLIVGTKTGAGLLGAGCVAASLSGCDGSKMLEQDQSACRIVEIEVGIRFECPNGNIYTVRDETPNEQCTVTETDEGAVIECPDGSSAIVSDGKDGKDGSSCDAYSVENGVIIACGDKDPLLVKHGQDGEDGSDGADGEDGEDAEPGAFNIVEYIDPCGKESAFDEILLVFANGDILGHYSNGKKQHFSLLSPGRYQTTDNTNCLFEISANGEVVW